MERDAKEVYEVRIFYIKRSNMTGKINRLNKGNL